MLNFFIERPVLSTVIALIMILSGALAALGLPIAQYPQVVPPQVTVNAAFPRRQCQTWFRNRSPHPSSSRSTARRTCCI